MTAAWERWQRFWFEQVDQRPLALVRIGWAIAVLFETYNERGRLVRYAGEQFHWPLLSFIGPVTPEQFWVLLAVAKVGALMALFGALPQVGAALVVYAHGTLFAVSLLNFRNHIYLLLLMGVVLALSPCGRALSVNAVVRRLYDGKPSEPLGSRWASRLLQVQLLLVYFWADLHKADSRYLEGYPMQVEMGKALRRSWLGGWMAPGHLLDFLKGPIDALLASQDAMAVFSFLVVTLEAFVVIGLCVPWLRRYAMAMGVALHAGILVAMNVVTFGIMMVAMYALFADPGWVAGVGRRLGRLLGAAPPPPAGEP